MKRFIITSAIAASLTLSCTKLKDTNYTQFIASQFNPSGDDLNSLLGSAYVDWRILLLNWNGLHRAQENTRPGGNTGTPQRMGGWWYLPPFA